jgi:hypothetical protein
MKQSSAPLPDWVRIDPAVRILSRSQFPRWAFAAICLALGFLAGVGFVLLVAP